jgi:hypothetical protein
MAGGDSSAADVHAIIAATTGGRGGDDDDEDDEEEELMMGEDDEVEEIDITEADESELSMFMPESQPNRRTLADIIMEKIAQKNGGQLPPEMEEDAMVQSTLDPKIVEVYEQVGSYLSHYTSGKVPKAFKIIPSLRNWEEVLFVTKPEGWTSQVRTFCHTTTTTITTTTTTTSTTTPPLPPPPLPPPLPPPPPPPLRAMPTPTFPPITRLCTWPLVCSRQI